MLEHAIANAMYGDDPTKPVALIDYGSSNSHLELRRGFPYNHVMPDLNGRRYDNYVLAAELADLAGKPAPQLRQRAEQLKAVLKSSLWNRKTALVRFPGRQGKKDARYTVQMFKLFGSNVLGRRGGSRACWAHLTAKRSSCRSSGCTACRRPTRPTIRPTSTTAGPASARAFRRRLPSGSTRRATPTPPRTSSNGSSGGAIACRTGAIPSWPTRVDYRKDTPLQCTIDGAAVAQCIIFGMFGVRAEFNGDIRINPHPPTFAPQMKLSGLRLRGHVLDIDVRDGQYEVRDGAHRTGTTVGRPILVHGDQLLHGE